jgi:peroxiredoxin Q/BCP
MLKEGMQAPDIDAMLDSGEQFRLADYRGTKNVVLYFYPKDFTMGCTREACIFRDRYDDVLKYDAIIVGVSSDTADTHKRFKEKHELPFPLVADPDKTVIRAYDAEGLLGISTARVTYVIDKQGKINSAIRHDFAVGRHLPEVLEALAVLEGKPAPVG